MESSRRLSLSCEDVRASSPVFGWSPLPPRKLLAFTTKSTSVDTESKEFDDLNNIKYYPNCDSSVWLRSCEQEVVDPLQGTITGTIPKWIKGSLIRNGPGSLKVGDMTFKHLFDSSALLHRFSIKDGNVTYQCQFLKTDCYKKNKAAKRIVVTEFGTAAVPDPCQSIFQKVSAWFTQEESDNAMISVYPFGDEYYAFTETTIIHRIDPDNLNTLSKLNVANYVAIVNHTSHPHVMEDGTVYNLGLSASAKGTAYNIICFPKTKEENMFEKASIVSTIPARWPFHPSYMHTFGITKNYYIIVEQPLSISIPSLLKAKIAKQPMAGCFRWYNDKQTIFQIISRDTGKLYTSYYAEAFFYLHIINQYEKDDHIVIDICSYRDPAMLDCMYIDTMKDMQSNPNYAKMFRGRPLRFVLPLLKNTSPVKIKSKSKNSSADFTQNLITLPDTKAKAYLMPDKTIFVKPELLCDLGCETPKVYYEKHLGMEYRYFYAISSDVDAQNPGTLIKVDIKTKSRKVWCENNCYPSEPIFVPKPNATAEDDGVVLAAMVWGLEEVNKVGLLILCAKTWTEIGRCEFITPGPVPKCLHGWFVNR